MSSVYQYQSPITLDKARLLCATADLKVIQTDRPISIQSLELLNEEVFRFRKDIMFRVYGSGGFWKEIDILRHLPEVERISWETPDYGSIEPFFFLRKLTHIRLGTWGVRNFKLNLLWLVSFKDDLTGLSLEGHFNDAPKLLPFLKNLRELHLTSVNLKDIQVLEGLPIEEFYNYGSKVEGLELLGRLKTIKRLRLKANTKLSSIEFISQLPLLEELDLEYVTHLRSFPKMDHLQNLKRVFAFECHNLEDLSELMKLKNCIAYANGKKLRGKSYSYAPSEVSK